MEIDADAWSLLCKVDGIRSVEELARDCGFTLYEAGQVVYTLVPDAPEAEGPATAQYRFNEVSEILNQDEYDEIRPESNL